MTLSDNQEVLNDRLELSNLKDFVLKIGLRGAGRIWRYNNPPQVPAWKSVANPATDHGIICFRS